MGNKYPEISRSTLVNRETAFRARLFWLSRSAAFLFLLRSCSSYGALQSIISLLQLWERFRTEAKPPQQLGSSRDYNVDLVPKFIMSSGNLVKILVTTDVVKYLEFKGVDGSYVLNKGRVEKVPGSDYEALRSPLLGLFEKRRARNFFL